MSKVYFKKNVWYAHRSQNWLKFVIYYSGKKNYTDDPSHQISKNNRGVYEVNFSSKVKIKLIFTSVKTYTNL